MSKSPEGYQPTDEEMSLAEGMMQPGEAELSEWRENYRPAVEAQKRKVLQKYEEAGITDGKITVSDERRIVGDVNGHRVELGDGVYKVDGQNIELQTGIKLVEKFEAAAMAARRLDTLITGGNLAENPEAIAIARTQAAEIAKAYQEAVIEDNQRDQAKRAAQHAAEELLGE